MCLPVLFVVFGDFRNLITPFGYWIAWLVWGGWVLRSKSIAGYDFLFYEKVFALGLSCLGLSFFISSLVNVSGYTAYQGVKLIFIGGLGWAIYYAFRSVAVPVFINASILSLMASVIFYVVSKYFFGYPFLVTLNDGREGDLIAFPGVLWKGGVFFLPFIIADCIEKKSINIFNGMGIVSGLYLICVDGSRTGLIWACLSIVALVLLFFYRYDSVRSFVSRNKFKFFSVIFSCLLAIVFLVKGVAYSRLLSGDPVRVQMFFDAIGHARECFPFGGGFSTAVTFTPGGYIVIHNAYLSSVGDIGVLGFLGVFMLFVSPIVLMVKDVDILCSAQAKEGAYLVASLLGVLGFYFSWVFHPLTTEMSEWGILFVMFSLLSFFVNKSKLCKATLHE